MADARGASRSDCKPSEQFSNFQADYGLNTTTVQHVNVDNAKTSEATYFTVFAKNVRGLTNNDRLNSFLRLRTFGVDSTSSY